MLVEVLGFPGCPHVATALELARRVAAEVRPEAEVQLVAVESTADAEAMRFLGSPSIRVDGHDVESGADERRDYTFGCRLHATAIGLRPLPSERWLRDALEATASAQPSIISASSVDTVRSEADTRRSTGL